MRLRTCSYLALGDSYTIGENIPTSQSWPHQLHEQLSSAGCLLSNPIIIAKTGWTTGDLLKALESADLSSGFDLVTLSIGVNNQYQGLDTGIYQAEFRALLYQAIHLTEGDPSRVIVVSIPDWGATPFAVNFDPAKIQVEIDLYNDINREQTQQAGSHYTDITFLSRQLSADRCLLTEDELHPNGKMYARWVEMIFPTAKQILQNKP